MQKQKKFEHFRKLVLKFLYLHNIILLFDQNPYENNQLANKIESGRSLKLITNKT